METAGLRRAVWLLLGLFFLLFRGTFAADKVPDVQRKAWFNDMSNPQYFDDSDCVLMIDKVTKKVYRSTDAGTRWKQVEDLGEDKIVLIAMNPHSKKVAVALSRSDKHFITTNRGESWRKFEIEDSRIPFAMTMGPLISFHADDEKRIILNAIVRSGPVAYYTTDGFDDKKGVMLRKDAVQCLWAKEQPQFTSRDESIDRDRTLCVAFSKDSTASGRQTIVMSDDFFQKHEQQPALEEGRPVPGIVSMVATKAFILAARRASSSNEMALYVTVDTKKWHRAYFGGQQVKERAYTVMESTNHSLQIDVSTNEGGSMGALFTSNSLGYSFVERGHRTNKDPGGYVDFEQVANIEGLALLNIVANDKEVFDHAATKRVVSRISFDEGRTFDALKADGDPLHLHSVTDNNNTGKVFSSLAPGIVMGVGNKGSELKLYGEGDLYVSDDAGATWTKAQSGPHKYEFGDQGSVLLAMSDAEETDEMVYSLNHGKHWTKISFADYEFKEGSKKHVKVRPLVLTTHPDSTSLKFLLVGEAGDRQEDRSIYTYTIDFSTLDLPRCKDDDFEDWYVRVNKKAEPRCVMGHKQKFRRRKADVECFVEKKFEDPKSTDGPCPCQWFDYECDEGFRRSQDRKTCEPIDPLDPPKGACKNGDETFQGPSGFRKVPGNSCEARGAGPGNKTSPVKRPCPGKSVDPPAQSGKITHKAFAFDATKLLQYFYLESSESSEDEDETVIVLTERGEVFLTHNHGKDWNKWETSSEVLAIFPHSFLSNQVYLITPSKTVYYSKNRGRDKKEMEAPTPPNGMVAARRPVLRFHPYEEDWLIWVSCTTKGSGSRSACNPQAHATNRHGMKDSWKPMLPSVQDCVFVWRERLYREEKLVYCMQPIREGSRSSKLLSSDNWFEDKKVLFEDMLDFAVSSEFIVVAARENPKSNFLKVDASLNGETFADVSLPRNLRVHHTTAYTVLDSSTHSVFLHITMNDKPGQEYGTIAKSNSNGTYYVKSLDNVNRNELGDVDFEKVLGLEGVAIANVVDNVDSLPNGSTKKLKTLITHDDGATWNLLTPPKKNADNKDYDCGSSKIEKCSLHLHGYSERFDRRITYSSPAAVGLVIAVGNVGEYLIPRGECDTFISRDGGMSWNTAKNGQFMWEYGDRGSVIVLVEEQRATKVVYYSIDEGTKWSEYQFSDEPMNIVAITTVPSDTSRNFLLWGQDTGTRPRFTAINLDFSGLTSKKCQGLGAGELDTPKSDYLLWEPKHPDSKNKKKNCLFGHVSQYIRKKPDRDCYNPPNFPDKLHQIKTNCPCSRQDFECDFNYERQLDGSCELVKGQKQRDGQAVCANKDTIEWYEPTAYRKLEISTCEGGRQLDKSKKHPCPGKEEEYREKEGGISGVGLFFAIVIPISAAAAVGWWMWRNLDGRFGRIRLGDGGDSAPAIPSRPGLGRNMWTKYPVMAISAGVAVIMAIPMLVGVLARNVRDWIPGGRKSYYSSFGRGRNGGPYTSRDSFLRGGRDYSDGPHTDERDLLGEDSDDDI